MQQQAGLQRAQEKLQQQLKMAQQELPQPPWRARQPMLLIWMPWTAQLLPWLQLALCVHWAQPQVSRQNHPTSIPAGQAPGDRNTQMQHRQLWPGHQGVATFSVQT